MKPAMVLVALLSAAFIVHVTPPASHLKNFETKAVTSQNAGQRNKLGLLTAKSTEGAVKQQPVTPPKEKPESQPEEKAVETPQPNTPQAWMDALGIPDNERSAVDYIMSQESGWCPTKWQGEIGYCPDAHGTPESENVGYGLCQATPAWKMASAGDDWATNPVTQLKWCQEHAKGYGGWIAAAEFKRCTGHCYSPKAAYIVPKATPFW